MTRRVFLTLLLGLCLVIVLMTGIGYQYRRSIYRKYLRLRLDASTASGVLSPEQFQVIQAAYDVVAPKPAPSSAELLEFVTWRTSNVQGYYREYTAAVQLLESKARRRFAAGFAALSVESRDQLLRDILPRLTLLPLQEALPIREAEPPGLARKVRAAVEAVVYRSEARLKYFVLWDLLLFYWSSNPGWTAVGYGSYPGVPDHPRGYTVPPGMSPSEDG
jgi:Gluconate 2-dehydrogenase subunit 3